MATVIHDYDVLQEAVCRAAEARGWLAGGWRLRHRDSNPVARVGAEYPNQLDYSGFCPTLSPLLSYQS